MNSAINKFLESRVEIITGMSSKEIHELGEELNSRAFYVAKLENHKLNAKIREVSDKFSKKQISLTEAKYFIKNFIADSQDSVAQKLARSTRIKQVLEGQRACARAVGEYASVARTKERYPYVKYICNKDGLVRASHKALDGKIFHIDDPYIQSHWPGSWDYNCRCTFKRMTAQEVEGKIIQTPTKEPVYDAETKARFNVANSFENDLSEVKDRDIMVKELTEMVRHGDINKMGLILSRADQAYDSADVTLSKVTEVMDNVKHFAQESAKKANWTYQDGEEHNVQNSLFGQNNPTEQITIPQKILDAFPKNDVSFGRVSKDLANDFEMNENTEIILTKGNQWQGLTHCWMHHKEVFADPKLGEDILKNTIGNKHSKVTLSLEKIKNGVVKRIAWFDDKTDSFCLGVYDDKIKKLKLVSWHRAKSDYPDEQWQIIKK